MLSFLVIMTVWAVMGISTIALREKFLEAPQSLGEKNDRQFGHIIFGGLLWPAYLPLFLMWAVGTGKVKAPPLTKRKTAEQKVLEYSQSPTKVLTEIICAKILAYPAGLNWYNDRWNSEDGKIKIWFNSCGGSITSIYSLHVNDKQVTGYQKEKLCKTLEECRKIQKEKEEADAEAKRQLEALQAVESLLLAPEPQEHPMGSHN